MATDIGEKRREYQRRYYQAHKEKAKEYQRTYNKTHKKAKRHAVKRLNNIRWVLVSPRSG